MAEEGDDAAPRVHVPLFFEGTLPVATNNVTNIITTTMDVASQRQRSVDFFTFLSANNPQLLQLNEGAVSHTALINIPRSSKVKVAFGISIGASPIGETSPLDGTVLCLSGDGGEDLGHPPPLVLPITILNTASVGVMTHDQFSTALTTKGVNYAHPLLAKIHVTENKDIMQLAPVPPFLVYDGWNSDLEAADVYERILHLEDTEGIEMFLHLKHFLLSCLSTHNAGDAKPYVNHTTLLTTPSTQSRRWAKTKFEKLFPTLMTITQAGPAATTPPDIAAIIAQLLPARDALLVAQRDEGKTNEENANITGMSQQELEVTLRMCGQPENGSKDLLPGWITQCAEKGTSDQYKLTIIRNWIRSNIKYDDADVPLTALLTKMILKRNWIGKDGNIRRPSILHANDGLSPFIVLDLNEDEVAHINEEEDALQAASLITLQDIKNLKHKVKPKVPETAEDFVLLLKRYANLLFALFTSESPFYKCIVQVIQALREYSKQAREALSLHSEGAILWIILLQSRRFGIGEMDILAEFKNMHSNLASKQNSFSHCELPNSLIKTTEMKKKKQPPTIDLTPNIPKRPKVINNPNNWNPKLRDALQQPLREARNPSFTKILKFCNVEANAVLKNNKTCAPNAYFGTCFYKDKCTKEHNMASEAEIAPILASIDKFVKSPKLILEGP